MQATHHDFTPDPAEFEGLPGAELVLQGLEDLSQGRCSESALLVLMASPRLKRLGVHVRDLPDIPPPYGHQLYAALEETCGSDAYSRYNSLLRRLASFCQALEHVRSADRVHPG